MTVNLMSDKAQGDCDCGMSSLEVSGELWVKTQMISAQILEPSPEHE